MFHLVMACMFFYRHCSRLKIYVSLLMLTIVAQYVKDLIFIGNTYYSSRLEEQYASSIDLLTLPMYAIVLVEACRPLWMNWSRAFCFYIPFVVLMVAFWVHPVPLAYYSMHFAAILCAVLIALWALRELPRFERALKEEYSYAEYINLHWLRGVILLFFCLLMLWVYDSLASGVRDDNIFLFNSLVMWIAACFCFYRQSVVINAVKSYFVEPSEDNAETNLDAAENDLDKATAHLEAAEADQNAPHAHTQPENVAETVAEPQPVAEQPVEPEPEELKLQQEAVFAERMYLLFEKEHVYLNPRLRLSELAMVLGTNRTYLSNFINAELQSSFSDYVNGYRVSFAKTLLVENNAPLDVIAEMSGFNSVSSFRRMFSAVEGCTPGQYRRKACSEKADG